MVREDRGNENREPKDCVVLFMVIELTKERASSGLLLSSGHPGLPQHRETDTHFTGAATFSIREELEEQNSHFLPLA